MKDIDWKLLSELIRNSRRSDRELAKAMGSSQPTVTRARKRLEKEGYIREYTMILNSGELGYEMLAVTFFNHRKRFDVKKSKEQRKSLGKASRKALLKYHS